MFAKQLSRSVKQYLRVCLLIVLLASMFMPSQAVFADLLTSKIKDLIETGSGDMGFTVSLSGNWAAVGAPGTTNERGSAYLYYRDQGGANNWGLVHTFVDPSPVVKEHYGYSVAVYADPADERSVTLVIGVRDESTAGKSAGAVYVYRRDQGGADLWGMSQSLITSPAVAKGDRFGAAVVIWNDTIVVGAPYEDSDPGTPIKAGSAYIFTRDQSGVYQQTGKVSGMEGNDRFGTGVAISGDTLAVGAPNNTSSGVSKAGTVYLYERNTDTGAWNFQSNLYASSLVSNAAFGQTVAISANTPNTLVVGAPGELTTGAPGAAYIYQRIQGTNTWDAPKTLSGVDNTLFGSGVALDGDVVAIGAPVEGTSGTVHVYARNEGGLNNWGTSGELVPTGTTGSRFGSALSLRNNILLVGSSAWNGEGEASLYNLSFSLEIDLNGAADGYDYAATFTEGDLPVSITGTDSLTLTDLDSTELKSATVTITNLLDGAAEELSATPTGAITADWIQYSNGVLTIQSPTPGGTALKSDFQAVLRTVRYSNTSENPSEVVRAVTFVANDGIEDSNTATSLVTVVAVNDGPTVDLNGAGAGYDYTAAFTEGDLPVLIVGADALTVVDPESDNLASATVTITNLQDGDAETLSAEPSGVILSGWISYTSGVLSIQSPTPSETAPASDFQAVLRTVRYSNTSQSPGQVTRSVTFVANDGAADGNTATSLVSVTSVNDLPEMDLNGAGAGYDFAATFTEGDSPVSIVGADALTVTDLDNTDLVSATVTITNLLDGAAEVLSAAPSGAITSDWISYINGVLSIQSPTPGTTAPLSDFQAVLRTVKYNNSSITPTETVRTVTFVVNDGVDDGNTANSLVTVNGVNNSVLIDLNGAADGDNYAATFMEGDSPVSITGTDSLTLTDLDSTDIVSATVTITNLLDGAAEELSATPSGAITQDWINYANGVLTIASPTPGGTAPLSDFQAVLRTVQYSNTSENPSEAIRSVTFVANDGTSDGNTALSLVTVTGVNDGPQVSAPATGTVDEDTDLTFAGTLSVSDLDAATLQITLTAQHGTVTLSTVSGLTFSTGDGTADASMAFTGAPAAVNAALSGAFFRPTADYFGSASITLAVNDQGSSGTGGALTDSKTIGITVQPVIDASSVAFGFVSPLVMHQNVAYDVTFRVTSAAAFPGAPTGSVTLTVNNAGHASCVGVLINGEGTCKLTIPEEGNFTITAQYGGDGNFAPSSNSQSFGVQPNDLYIPFVILR